MKTVQCRECFMRQAVQGGVNGGGSEIKTAWMFGTYSLDRDSEFCQDKLRTHSAMVSLQTAWGAGGHLWGSGTPGYVKPYTPEGADVNYEQLCFMVSTFVGTGMQGHLTGYKLTSSPTSTKMLRCGVFCVLIRCQLIDYMSAHK